MQSDIAAIGESLSARLHHATSFLRAMTEFRTEHFDTQFAEGRQTAMTDKEIYAFINEIAPDRFAK